MSIATLGWLAEHVGGSHGVVYCHGCFDCLHLGHVRHFKAAREYGDILIVTVTPDRYVRKEGRPIFSEWERAEMINYLSSDIVDYVAVNQWPTAVQAIKLLRPDFFAKGREYQDKLTPMLEAEKAALQEVEGRLIFTDTEEFHTTDILKACASR